MSWTKDKNGTWQWKPDGKGNPNKAGDNTTPTPTSPFASGATDSGTGTADAAYTVDVGFGLVDKNGNPLSLPPVQIGSTIAAMAGTDPKAYARVKAAVASLTGKKTLDPNYVGGYVQKLATNIMASSDILARSGNLEDYIKRATTTSTSAATPPQSYVSSATQAKSDINTVFKELFNREATDKELKALTTILNDAQKKNPSTYINGVTYGGLDKKQFLIDTIQTGKYEANPKAYPGILSNLATEAADFASTAKTKKLGAEEAAVLSNKQSILATAINNGINLTDDQVESYLADIKAGKDVSKVQQELRGIASLGMPDSVKKLIDAGSDLNAIYSPYKRVMAASLDLDPNTIPLDDATLRMAIGPDKEMSLYDYKKAVRKDNRWKYSEEANDEVSSMINQVKRDFGFMG